MHGGGFYSAVKYWWRRQRCRATSPGSNGKPTRTWLSGFALLVVIYYWSADLFLIDRTVLAARRPTAIAISPATLVAGWLVYEAMCRSPLGANENLLAAIGFVFSSRSASASRTSSAAAAPSSRWGR